MGSCPDTDIDPVYLRTNRTQSSSKVRLSLTCNSLKTSLHSGESYVTERNISIQILHEHFIFQIRERAILNLVSKEIQESVGFTLLCFTINPEISRCFLNRPLFHARMAKRILS